MSVEYDSKYPVPRPQTVWETVGFWEGIERHELVFQKCGDCGMWAHPPRPMCPRCRSLEKEWVPSSGKGTIHSVVTYRESPDPAFKVPYSVVLVELEEGVKLISNMADMKSEDIQIGMSVEVVFEEVQEDITLPKFRKAG